ncbi:membrane protein insertase YidC [Nocardia seriolae]|uniref:Membrane protein insertase YidC n=1 Tax=Nocardia seriolae TaxID=37332 RepID=A0A0B8MZF5_9NOCA|nr:membrane protein insertase YidC [Nocardia seriolae]APA94709.1 Membrane protein insertase YidC [Nocardia seriolae]MTJ60005.1 membrane protein insertase YidC [Nocardia seriolae]MTJ70075.1 membrane protein insertase YidC [Nocardia seriolae]MTJ85007.1 membrane protein insertase YidC [Nocardia seriolae]MTK29002.1 membrane protein insertase YidC [Nocardia seriolae]
MLDFIYYPVSAILWFWHQAFGYVLGKNSGFAWALAVVFLVFTLRLVLYKPFVKQVRTTRQMQELQPQIKELQKKYKNDRQQMTVEMQKLQKEHGFNPLMGCLPVLLQVPVFIGLFHVLRSFNRVGSGGFGGFGSSNGMTAEQNANTANYIFSPADVQSFLSARLFGAPLSSYITQPMAQLQSFAEWGGVPSKVAIAAVSIPLMIIAGVATHMNARASVARQSAEAAANPQAAMMNKLALYVFPLGVLVGGPFLPVAILLYWVSNNIWTYGQQHLVFGKIEKEEEEKKQAALERRAQNAPKPGAKPVDVRKKQAAAKVEDASSDAVEDAKTDAPQASQNGSKPAPGAKPGQAKKRSGNRGRANQKRRR